MSRQLVLVVDDDKNVCELLAEGLDAAKFEVAWTTDPRSGEELIEQRAFDVALTDVHTGQPNGLELCARLAQRQRGLPVVVMAELGSIDAAVRALRAGAHDFLTKPLDMELAGVTLERAIQHAALQRELAELRRVVAASRSNAAAVPRGNSVERADLPDEVRERQPAEEVAALPGSPELPSLEEVERRYILRVFEAVRGNKSQAALVLGLDRKTLYRRLERYGMLRTDGSRAERSRSEPATASGTR